jgi:hypothetical protein
MSVGHRSAIQTCVLPQTEALNEPYLICNARDHECRRDTLLVPLIALLRAPLLHVRSLLMATDCSIVKGIIVIMVGEYHGLLFHSLQVSIRKPQESNCTSVFITISTVLLFSVGRSPQIYIVLESFGFSVVYTD